jgi:hypothetical protein
VSGTHLLASGHSPRPGGPFGPLHVAAFLVLTLAATIESAWSQTAPEIDVVAHQGSLQAPNNFSLALDGAGNVYVGGANSGNVLRMAPRGDQPGPNGDPPCVIEILSEAKALSSGTRSLTPCPAGLRAPGFSWLGPKGIAVSSNGTVYVTGTGGNPNACDNIVGIFPDGTIAELVNRADLGIPDWNPAGIGLDENGGSGVFVYANGPAPALGQIVRISIAPDRSRTFQTILQQGGSGLVVDGESHNVYVATTNQVVEIPDARSGACNDDEGKQCPSVLIDGVTPDCNNKPITLSSAYALALAGGILYVTGQGTPGKQVYNVLRLPIRANNALGLPLCVQEIFRSPGGPGPVLTQPRAIAADSSGNVYVAGNLSNNVVWIRPNPVDKTKVISQEIINRTSGLVSPEAVAVDSVGNVYVSGNQSTSANVFRIRTVTAGLACGDGVLEGGEACDYRLDCCCSVNCGIESKGAICRETSGLPFCDVTDVCTGTSATCSFGSATCDLGFRTPTCPPKALGAVSRRYNHAHRLILKAETLCPSGHFRKSRALLRRAKKELELAIVDVVVLAFGHTNYAQCADDVNSLVEQDVEQLRGFSVSDVQKACNP